MSRKPPPPNPERVWASLEFVQNVLIPTIISEYREAHHYRFGRRDRAGDHKDHAKTVDAQGQERTERQEQVSQGKKSRFSNPTQTYALDQEWLGDRLRTIGPRILDVEKTMRSIRGSLGSLFEDPQEEYGPMRRDPIADSKQTDDKKRGERFQSKRHIQEEIDRHKMEAARLERELRESA